MTILLIRHGESEANADYGVTMKIADHAVPLTPRGHDQAIAAGRFVNDWFKNNPPRKKVRLWSSPYLRATQTAVHVRDETPDVPWDGGALDHDIHFDARLREREWGPHQYEGYRPANIVEKLDPEYQEYYLRTKHTPQGEYFVRPRFGESVADIAMRLHSFFHDLHFDRQRGVTDHVIVAHARTIQAFMQAMTKLHPGFLDKDPLGANASVRLLDIDPKTDKYTDYGFIYDADNNIYLLDKPVSPVQRDLRELLKTLN